MVAIEERGDAADRGGGISVNGERITDEKARLRPEDAIHGRYFVIRKGKKDNFLVRVSAVIDRRAAKSVGLSGSS